MYTAPLSAASAFSLRAVAICKRTHLPIARAGDCPVHAEVLGVWETKRRGRTIPSKADIDAFDFSPLALPLLMILDVQRNPLRFRYRLTGTTTDLINDANLTGLYVDQISPLYMREDLEIDLADLVDRKVPQLVALQFTNIEDCHRRYKILRLPLAGAKPGDDALRVDHVLVAFGYT